MNRAELKTIAEGFKSTRPPKMAQFSYSAIAGGDLSARASDFHYTEAESFAHEQWRKDVTAIATKLQLDPKARSNFEAACGLIHSDQG